MDDEYYNYYNYGNDSYDENYTYEYVDYPEDIASDAIYSYVAPFIIILGTLGNIIAFIVLQHESYRKQSTGFILSALAVVDTGMLLTGLLRYWILNIGNQDDIRDHSQFSCRFHYFLTYFFSHASPMTISLMSVERAFSVWLPFKVKSVFTRKKVAIIWSFCIAILLLLNTHGFVTVSLEADEYGIVSCYFHHYKDFHMKAWYWIDAVFSCYLPLLIIITCNVLIIVKISSATVQRQSMGVRNYKRTLSTVITSRSTTIMLVTVSVMFFICTLPQAIYLTGTGSLAWWPEETYHDIAKLQLAHSVTAILFYLNNAINFPLYCLAGSRFRRTMKEVFTKFVWKKLPSSSYVGQSSKSTKGSSDQDHSVTFNTNGSLAVTEVTQM